MDANKQDTDLDIVRIGRTILAGWRSVVCVTAASFLLATAYLHFAKQQYTATMMVSPVVASSNLSSSLSTLAAGAAALGISTGPSQVSDFQKFEALLTSRKIADAIAQQPALMHALFPDSWDAQNNRWRAPHDIVSILKQACRAVLAMPTWQQPTGEDVVDYLSDELTVSTSDSTGLLVLSFEHPDPKIARDLLNQLYRLSDDSLRAVARQNSQRRIEYLKQHLSETSQNDLHLALINVLSGEQQNAMLIAANRYYAAEVIDPPTLMRDPSSPRTVVVIALSLFCGIVLGSIIALAGGLTNVASVGRAIIKRKK